MRIEDKREKDRERQRKWRKANPDKRNAATRRYRVAHREELRDAGRLQRALDPDYASRYRAAHVEKVRAAGRKWYAANAEKERKKSRKRRGLPVPTRPMPELCEANCGRKASHLDHCHETGLFRGWLCNHCNLGIGKLGDNLEGLARATAYLIVAPGASQAADYGELAISHW